MKDESTSYGPLVNKGYRPRIVEGRIRESLEDFGAVCIEGAKYCGKTWAAQALAESQIDLADPAGNFQNLEVASLDPVTALMGASPRLVDEWQEAPLLWDGVRNAVDSSGKARTFILTGSSIPKRHTETLDGTAVDGSPRHSGVGRIEKIRMRTMTLAESGESVASVSLKGLLAGDSPSATAPQSTLSDISELVARGGWPAVTSKNSERAQRVARSYLREVCWRDISRIDGTSRDPDKVSRLLHSLARNAEQATKSKTIIANMTETATEPALAAETVTDYLQALKRMLVVEEIRPWAPRLRSTLRINKRPKYHFVDPSLAVAALRTSAQRLTGDLETLGFLFECLCVRDLLVYAQAMDAQVYYYRDQAGLEMDAVIETADGLWAGIEVKLGHNQADAAAGNLLTISRKIVAAGGSEPAFLAVIEGLGSFAYRRDDGVLVIPIRTLGP